MAAIITEEWRINKGTFLSLIHIYKEIEGDLEDFYMEQFDDAEDTVDSFTVSENSGDLGDFRKRGSK